MPASPDIDRLERIRTVTADFGGYQGLYTCLLGLFMVFMSLFQGRFEVLVGGLVLMGLLLFAVRGHYRRRFGQVRPRWTTRRVLWVVLLPMGLLIGYLVLIGVTNVLGVQGGWVFGVFIAVFLAVLGFSAPLTRWHYLVGAALLLALIPAPLGTLVPSGIHPFAWEYPIMVPLVAGVILVVNGLLDHRTLVRTLTPVSENETD